MSEDYKAKVQVFFQEADSDGTGSVSRVELCKVTQKAGFNYSVDEISSWFDEIDKNDDDKLTFDEFWAALSKRSPADVTESELRCAFKQFDTDGSGQISWDEMKAVLENAGHDASHVQAVLDAVDTDSDGKINAEEFLAAWKDKS